MSAIRLLLADDNTAFRQRLVGFLRDYGDLAVVGEAANGRDAVRLAGELRPDLVLMDVRMPEMNGLTALCAVKALPKPPKVIVLTVFDDAEYRKSAQAAGADGYIVKAAIGGELVPAIREQTGGARQVPCPDERRAGRGQLPLPFRGDTPGREDDQT